MELTRKRFLASAAAFSAATGVDLAASAESVRTENPFRAKDYEYFRKVLKAFFPPGYCRKECQDPLQVASAKTIRSAMIAWSDAHPDSDALDARRESYMLMRKHFYPILFPDSPFYCECGINGGWSGARPVRRMLQVLQGTRARARRGFCAVESAFQGAHDAVLRTFCRQCPSRAAF